VSWVAIDDKFPRHPKVLALGKHCVAGKAQHLDALCYSNEYLTDGFVPREVISDPVAAKALVRVGLWETAKGGYMIHDYADYQPSKAEIEAKRVKTHEARVRAGKKRGETAQRCAGGMFAGQDQHTDCAGPAATSTPPAGHQPPAPTQEDLIDPPRSLPGVGRKDGGDKSPSWADIGPATGVFAEKLDRELTDAETDSVTRWVRRYGSPATCSAIGASFEVPVHDRLKYIGGTLRDRAKETTCST
jgi:hypothetical protein